MQVYKIYNDVLNENHCIIAGQSGSGKSVIINGLIKTALVRNNLLILIDPKKVELIDYKHRFNTLIYADNEKAIIKAIARATAIMDNRYKLMQLFRHKKSKQAHIYIIIDEFADLITMYRKEVLKPICRLAQLGRAANIHLIIATQRPTSDIINGQIKVNIDCRLSLKVPTAQDSKNLIGVSGAESLPRFGQGYLKTVNGLQVVNIPML